MSRMLAMWASLAWIGATLLLSRVAWFRGEPLADRLRPFAPGARPDAQRAALSVASFRDVFTPLARSGGERLARLFGTADGLGVRLQRIGSPLDAGGFRVRQTSRAALSAGLALMLVTATGLPLIPAALVVTGLPVLVFLVIEQRLITSSRRRQQQLFDELPVISEQLAMLLGAGYSLGSALNRLAGRGAGIAAENLRGVTNRIRQGLSETEALREWAELMDVPELRRLVNVLSFNREAGDLGRLIAEESRAMRRESHRRLLALVERRSQLVWIPVTVATLVPGVLLMAIPFLSALDAWSAF